LEQTVSEESKGRGRPPFEPSEDDRKLVKALTAYGIPQFEIARLIHCSVNTLHTYFQYEIETATAEANGKVAQTLFNIATKSQGKEAVTACIFWLKCRAGWRDVDTSHLVGKKELSIEAARTAGEGTDWGDDLTGRGARLN
jgi:hypothetical protein